MIVNMVIATAEAKGQSLLLKNSCHRILPIRIESLPPNNSGITYSPMAGNGCILKIATEVFLSFYDKICLFY